MSCFYPSGHSKPPIFHFELHCKDLEGCLESRVYDAYRDNAMYAYVREDLSGLNLILVTPFHLHICCNFSVFKNKIISEAVESFGYSKEYFEECDYGDCGYSEEEG